MSRSKRTAKRGRLCKLCSNSATKRGLCGKCLNAKRTSKVERVYRVLRSEDAEYPPRRHGNHAIKPHVRSPDDMPEIF